MDENERLEGAGEVVTPEEDVAAAPEEGEKREAADPPKGKQSHEENRRYQAARQAGEKAAEERLRKDVNRRIAALGMKDLSGREILDMDHLESYGKEAKRASMAERAKKENKTMSQIEDEEADRDKLREIRAQEAETERQKREAEERRKFIAEDVQDFRERFPEVDLESLDKNGSFRRFCGSRYGREPLGDLYEDWQEITGNAAKSAAAKAESKSERSTGAGGGAGAETLTAAQQKELDEWNRENPRMKMTAKEFLGR